MRICGHGKLLQEAVYKYSNTKLFRRCLKRLGCYIATRMLLCRPLNSLSFTCLLVRIPWLLRCHYDSVNDPAFRHLILPCGCTALKHTYLASHSEQPSIHTRTYYRRAWRKCFRPMLDTVVLSRVSMITMLIMMKSHRSTVHICLLRSLIVSPRLQIPTVVQVS